MNIEGALTEQECLSIAYVRVNSGAISMVGMASSLAEITLSLSRLGYNATKVNSHPAVRLILFRMMTINIDNISYKDFDDDYELAKKAYEDVKINIKYYTSEQLQELANKHNKPLCAWMPIDMTYHNYPLRWIHDTSGKIEAFRNPYSNFSDADPCDPWEDRQARSYKRLFIPGR